MIIEIKKEKMKILFEFFYDKKDNVSDYNDQL